MTAPRHSVAQVPRMEDIMPLILETLAAGHSIRVMPMGTSMLPMLRQGIDSVVLSPVPQRLKKYDLPLYRRKNGQYVLHRIVSAGQTYVCMGDNQFSAELGIGQEQMIALVSAFYRGEKKYAVNAPGYRLYCRLWYHTRRLRRFWRRGMGWLRRHFGA